MAVVSTRAGRLGNRIAVAAVILITLIFLSPIYWITSTAFKPLLLSTTVPPTTTPPTAPPPSTNTSAPEPEPQPPPQPPPTRE